MKKGVAVVIVCVSILLLVSMPIVSANWFDDLLNNIADFFGSDAGITGNVIGDSCTGTPTISCGDYAYVDLGCNGNEPLVCGDVGSGGSNCGPGGDDGCYDCVLVLDCENLNQVQCGEMEGLGCAWGGGGSGGINFVPDASFETQTLQSPYSSATSGNLEIVNSQAYAGSWSLKHTSTGTTSNTLNYYGPQGALASVSPGEVWIASVWVKPYSGTTPGVKLRISALGSSKTVLEDNSPSEVVTTTSSWQKITVQMTMPVGAAYVSTRVANKGGNGAIVYWDDWQLYNEDSGPRVCGDGVTQTPNDAGFNEQCDDGNSVNGDGCSNACQLDGGGSLQECGNGLVESPEVCDGTNLTGLGVTCGSLGYDSGTITCNANCWGYSDTSCVGGNWVCSGTPENFCLPEFLTQETCENGGLGDFCSWDVVSETCNTNACSSFLTEPDCSSAACTWESSGEGAGETCGNEILDDGEECDGALLDSQTCSNQPGYVSGTLECDNDCIGFNMTNCILDENEVLGCTDIGAANYNSQATINDGSCISSIDCEDGNCNYYNITKLLFYADEVLENAEIPVTCKFGITNDAGGVVSNANVSQSCVFASIGGDSSGCSILLDGVNSEGIYYRSFNCDVGGVGINKEVKCLINQSESDCVYGDNPSSEAGLINVTTPLTCPAGLVGDGFSINSSIDLENSNLDAGDTLEFNLELIDATLQFNSDVMFEAGLYELNLNKTLDLDTKTLANDASLSNAGISLNAPSTSSTGNHRIYIKTSDADETQFCILDKYDINVKGIVFDPSGVDADFRYLSRKSIEINTGEIITFTLNGAEGHSIELESIVGTTANLVIKSDPINVELSEGEEEKIDLNGDGIFNILIKLTEITGNSIVITLEALEAFETCRIGQIRDCGEDGTQFCTDNVWGECTYNSAVGSSEENNNVFEEGEKDEGSFPWIIVIVILIIVAVFFILIIISKRKFDKKVSNGGANFSQANNNPGPRSASPGQHVMRRPVVRRN